MTGLSGRPELTVQGRRPPRLSGLHLTRPRPRPRPGTARQEAAAALPTAPCYHGNHAAGCGVCILKHTVCYGRAGRQAGCTGWIEDSSRDRGLESALIDCNLTLTLCWLTDSMIALTDSVMPEPVSVSLS